MLDASMVNTLMEHSAPSRDSDLRHPPAGLERKDLGWDAGFGGSEGGGDLFAPSGITLPAASSTLPSFPNLEVFDLLSESLETFCSKTRISSEESIPEVPQEEGTTFHVELPPPPPPPPSPSPPPLHPGPESLGASSSETFCLRDVLVPSSAESPNPLLDHSSHEDTQALFWASICRVQQCLLDLQGEMDRKEEPSAFSSQAPEEAPPMDWASTCEPSHLGSDSGEEEEESSGRLEEEPASWEEEEEEEMEYLFYNNPLFQESSRPARAIVGFEGLVLVDPPEGEAPGCGEEGPPGSAMALKDDSLFHQTSLPGSPAGTRPSPLPEPSPGETPCPFPSYVPHCRSWSPLVITEGDPDESGSPVMERETQGCLPERQPHSPSASLPEGLAPGTNCGLDPPTQDLLLSPSRTSLASAWLLQTPPEGGSPCKPPLPPAKARGGLPIAQALPGPAGVEQSLGPERPRGQAPSPGCHVPSCAWAVQPSGTSPQQKEVVGLELSFSIHGAGRKPGGSAEGSERMAFPGVPGQVEEILDHEEEEEEEEVPPSLQGIPEEEKPVSNVPVVPADALKAKDLGGPEGAPLCANGTAGDQAAALRLATRLYHLDGFQRSQVATFLQKNNEFSQKVAEAYLSFFEFKGKTLDQALRSFLQVFVLTGETQERERILQHFSQRYHTCNPQAFRSPGAVHTLTCALMLLHTDLHGQNIGRSMSCQAFVANLEGLNDGQNFPKELLKALYYSIRHEKLEWAVDEDTAEAEAPPQGQPSPLSVGGGSSFPSQTKSNPFLSLVHDPGAQTYRKGLLARKVLAEADGKKTPWGKRGWKVFHTVLKGMVMYFFKEENRPGGLGTEEPLGVHHALAERDSKYTKRPHVFRLQTADWRVFLFQAPSAEEMSSWISRINLVAAMFSSPPFPAAVGSQRKFIRPILPTAPCKNPLEEQYEAHDSCLDKASDDLLELQRNLPDRRGSRARDLEEYRLRKEYLLYEKRRYETYVRLLEVKLSSGSPGKEDLDQWEARLGEAGEADQSSVGLQKSHSSPSLNAEGPPPTTTTVKVKRNISERRTVRKIIPKRNKHLL